MRKPVALVVLLALVAVVLALGPAVTPASADDPGVPSRSEWLKDVNKVMKGSGAYLRERTASGETGLAINFDIDNSALTSYYDGDESVAIPRMLRLAAVAERRGVALVFNTGRYNAGRKRALSQLEAAGYDVAALCMRKRGERIQHSKQRCRDRFVDAGYTLVANIGNNPTDFTGAGYEKAYRLPSYGGLLG